jgi:hypothetical protein
MSETKKTIKEKLWSISENPYYKMNPETGQYEMVDEETVEKVKKQEQDEYNAAEEEQNKKYARGLEDEEYFAAMDKRNKQNAGRKKRRTRRRKSNKRKSNKRKSRTRRGSRRR